MTIHLSHRMNRLHASPIREILSVAGRSGMISFAGGLPSHTAMPALETMGFDRSDLQYGPSEGELVLRELIAADLHQRGLPVNASQVLVLSGSQQGIDLVAKLMIDEGTKVSVESPTYLAALQVFTMFGAQYSPFDIDSLDAETDNTSSSALLYTNPTFQNPTSLVYSLAQREKLARFCDIRNIVLFEDDPYRELCYEPSDRQPVCSMVKSTSWVYQSSFSKTISPGLRLGYLVSSPEVYPHLLKLKQASDLHSSRISQRLVYQILSDPECDLRLMELRNGYRAKRDHFNQVLERYMPTLADWKSPAGGLFFWLMLKSDVPVDTRKLLPQAIDMGITFMPGEPFFSDGRTASNYIRLNFSHAQPADVETGLSTLARIVEAAV